MRKQGTRFGIDFNPTVETACASCSRQRPETLAGQRGGRGHHQRRLLYPAPVPRPKAFGDAACTKQRHRPADGHDPALVLDTANDRSPSRRRPNDGTLNPTGALGIDASGDVGFDIQSTRRGDAGPSRSNRAFASIAGADGRTAFYAVDLLTGAATPRGRFPVPVVDIALPLG